MKIENFEDLIAWQKSKEFTLSLYSVCKNCREYGLKDKLVKAGLDTMNCIAQGFETGNNETIKQKFTEAKQFISACRSMLHILYELDTITIEEFENLTNTTWHITKMLQAFVKSIESSEKK